MPPKIVVHSDILLDFLIHQGNNKSMLRSAMEKFFCYTTVFNAIELFSIARNEKERKSVEHAMSAMKILGLNAKNAKKYGDLLVSAKRLSRFDALVAGVCVESRLPLLTGEQHVFRGVKELMVLPASKLRSTKSGLEILNEFAPGAKSN